MRDSAAMKQVSMNNDSRRPLFAMLTGGRQISYLTMIFLPASYLSVSCLRRLAFVRNSWRLIERVRNERRRDQPWHSRDFGLVCHKHCYLDGDHRMGRGRLARPQLLPRWQKRLGETCRMADLLHA